MAYDPKSLDPASFIDHDEAMASMAHARANATETRTIRAILDKIGRAHV